VAEALKVQGISCAAHVIAKSVEHMFRAMEEVEMIHKLPERLAKPHNGHAYKDYLPLVRSGNAWWNAPEYCIQRWGDAPAAIEALAKQRTRWRLSRWIHGRTSRTTRTDSCRTHPRSSNCSRGCSRR
jgi:hypothetical protein